MGQIEILKMGMSLRLHKGLWLNYSKSAPKMLWILGTHLWFMQKKKEKSWSSNFINIYKYAALNLLH
jgi:hypothetical protein